MRNPDTFLYNTGPITTLNDADWNRRQYISVTETWAQGAQPKNTPRVNRLVRDELTAPVNIGSKSTPKYANLAKAAQFSMRASNCLLYTSPSPRDRTRSRMPSSA